MVFYNSCNIMDVLNRGWAGAGGGWGGRGWEAEGGHTVNLAGPDGRQQ